MKKIILSIILFTIPFSAYAGAKGISPVVNQTVQGIGGNDSDNNVVPIHVTTNGEVLVSGSVTTTPQAVVPPSTYSAFASVGAAANVVKASPGVIESASVRNRNIADRYLLLVDKDTAPINTDTPIAVFILAAEKQTIIGTDFFTNAGLEFQTGAAYCISTTDNECTIASDNDFDVMFQYE